MSIIKKCSKCGTWWIAEQGFHRDRSRKDGYAVCCFVCISARAATRLAAAPIITVERLHELLIYDPESGEFRDRRTGAIVGSYNSEGYWQIYIDGRSYKAHRLVHLWMNGSWPEHEIDHRDTDRGNNRWTNLRHATRSQNSANTRAYANNQLGRKGLYQTSSGKFVASISVDGKRRHLGNFTTIAESSAAYARAAAQVFGEFARAE